ncbi:hypothetical protein AB0O28_22650 [Microbispora sp. NPDC088329]|uniref:hypothetical protein n=1 Tax=Microbispora sp. NPDC088329 TaxID=3154869 RepID=UPI00341ECF1B
MQDFDYLGEKYFPHWLEAGRALGQARATLVAGIVTVLEMRGVKVSDDAGKRIDQCESLDQLGAWLRKAPKVKSADDLFV